MISLIIGKKGSGKTKKMVELCNAAVATSNGNVVCVEKGNALTYNLTHRARLINVEEFEVSGYHALYGFVAGMCAANFDITDIFVDATLRIGGRDYEQFAAFIEELFHLATATNVRFTVTVSCDENELPASVFEYASKV